MGIADFLSGLVPWSKAGQERKKKKQALAATLAIAVGHDETIRRDAVINEMQTRGYKYAGAGHRGDEREMSSYSPTPTHKRAL